MIRLYRINTGSCGGCDEEILAMVAMTSDMEWAHTLYDADTVLLTGPITRQCQPLLRRFLLASPPSCTLVVGRCALDGHPFGKGGRQEWREADELLGGEASRVNTLDACPVDPVTLAEAIRRQVNR